MTFFFTNSSEILVPPLPSLRLDEKKLESYLRSQPNLNIGSSDHLHIMQFKYGQSNPTYLITLGGFKCVLRKSPPGKLLKGAHQVEREAKIMHQMHGFIPVPQIHHICNDDTVIGTPFYLMEHIQGVIYKDPSLPSLSPEDRTKVYSTFCETLAKIHSIRPEQLGLTHMAYFNRYCSRQIKIWSGQYERSCQDPVRGDPNMDRLSTWLLQHVPPGDTEGMYGGSGPRIIHGDYRLDNVIFDASDPSRILAVLDWELSSIGDVFTDLAHACMPYHLPPVGILTGLSLRKRERKQSGDNNAYVSTKDDFVVGVPSESQFLEQYFIFRQRMEEERNNIHNHSHRHTTMSLSSSSFVLHHWSFYTVLALYRSCSILFGVYSRLLQGNAASSSQTADGDCSNRNESHGGGSHGRELQRIIPAITTTAIAIIDADSIPSPNTGRLTRAASMSTDSTVTGSGTGTGKPGLQPSSRGQALLQRLKEFINKEMLPIETELLQYYTVAEGKWPERGDRWVIHPLLESLTRCARETGLWNLWMPSTLYEQLLAAHPHWDWDSLLPHRKESALTNLDYAHLAIASGYVLWTPEILNCSAPDTGNMDILGRFGTSTQRETWLLPLLTGEKRSCFGMTEPEVSSSDPTQLAGTADKTKDGWRINGRKWWTSGACDPRCDTCLYIARTSTASTDSELPHRRHSILVLSMHCTGVKVVTPLTVFGYDDAPHGHAEVIFNNVLAPHEALLGETGKGFSYAQTRLGPGRLHHCCRLIGHAQRALHEAVQRGQSRKAFKTTLLHLGGNAERLALAEVSLQQARLAVLQAALELDNSDLLGHDLSPAAMHALAIAKIAAPQAAQTCLDLAIQLHGAEGLSSSTPLAAMWAAARAIRIVDGADEVHIRTLVRLGMAAASDKEKAKGRVSRL